MQRFHPLRWLAFAIALLATQCLDSISDDCTKTLTCGNGDDLPTLRADCVWRYPNGKEWIGGPERDVATGRWRWPDGRESDTQTLACSPADAGTDAGLSGPDCRKPGAPPCDDTFVCDPSSGACVHCIDSTQCSVNAAVGDAGAATVCDTVSHECVECLRSDDCVSRGDRPICKVDLTDTSINRCVQCQEDGQCTGETPACDENTNECTRRCTVAADCTSQNKPFCNFEQSLCVECRTSTDCTGTDSQCKPETSSCVECIDDAPCSASGKVCDTTKNTCVQCYSDAQCTNNPAGPFCDSESNLCVQCLSDLQCTGAALSRCSLSAHLCVGCTDSSQCENGLVCNPTLNGGTCVQCVDNTTCTTLPQNICETATGRCVECLTTEKCTTADLARCEIRPDVVGKPQYSCTGCIGNADCGGKDIPGLCREIDGKCVTCEENAQCIGNTALSRCDNGGECSVCLSNGDCSLFDSPGLGKQACKPEFGCVECVLEGDCAASPTLKHCKTAASAGPAINTCVECRNSADCTTAGESRCVNNACEPCVADADCNGADGMGIDSNGDAVGGTRLRVCDAGTCVQCTGPKRAACGTNVCNSLNKVCSAFPAGSAIACDTCVSDAQCTAGTRCVQHTFGTSSVYSCFPLATGSPPTCSDRVFFGLNQGTTIDVQQAPPATCLLRRTSCEGYRDYEALTECTADTDCGAPGVADGLCETGQCTVPCDSSNDCPAVCEVGGFCRL